MALFNPRLTKSNQFIKSSYKDLQDPVFLTFDVDFFPVGEEFPRGDGLYNNNLLRIPPGSEADQLLASSNTQNPNSFRINGPDTGNPNREIEYSAYDWLHEYYGPNYAKGQLNRAQPHPGTALGRVIGGLSAIQSSPWYFQSVSGIPDLWKQAQKVKEGTMKATLTFSCLESIRQPLTDIAENYRYAIYDSDRLAYRLPENLRWFDMDIRLLEGRNLTDHNSSGSISSAFQSIFSDNSLDLFVKDIAGNVVSGIKVIKFKCKMCEFDFSDFLSGSSGAADFSVVIPDAPFKPSFKVNVGWVIQEEVTDEDVEDIRQSNILSGALDALTNKLSSTLSRIASAPGDLVDAAVNSLQTKIEGFAMGNIYTGKGLNSVNSKLDSLKDQAIDFLNGRKSPVGPEGSYNVADRALTPPAPTKEVGPGELGNSYPLVGPPPNPVNLGGAAGYGIAQSVAPVTGLDTAYEAPPREPDVVQGGAAYTGEAATEDITDIGDSYPDLPAPGPVNDIGDSYDDLPTPSPIGIIGDSYPNLPTPGPVGDLGDSYADPAGPEDVSDLGDSYADQTGPAQVSDIGDSYEDPAGPEDVSDLGDVYPDVKSSDEVSNLGDSYEDPAGPDSVGNLGDSYTDSAGESSVGEIGDTYQG